MILHVEGDNIPYEIIQMENGKKIIIYLKYHDDTYFPNNKGRGTHFLEQIFDENSKLIKETIKENPHQVILTEEQIDKTRRYVEEYDKKLKKSVQKYKKKGYLKILEGFFV